MRVRDADLLLDSKTGLSSEWHFEILYGFIFPIADRGVPLTLVLFGIDETEWAADAPDPDQAAWAAGGDRVEIPAHRWNV